ncbi:uncharacterized protein LOC129605339 [Condylostylus longicornis]|uniref:uncharacterized protein LOC129605339 n=1 Tax=Condylostylus longicornis TaxID=2530218 RepID=UPI00244E197A|nr:uncharacterized protein LOC129605339 [Condylostylus longicornis]
MEADSVNNKRVKFIFKLDRLTQESTLNNLASKSTEEWGSGGGWPGPEIIVEIQETGATDLTHQNVLRTNSTLYGEDGPKLIVRTEEVLIVSFVLLMWMGAIMLFFNRWGKIRMLEPYQPKFEQKHRTSCQLVDMETMEHPRSSISRMSMGLAVPINMPSCSFTTYRRESIISPQYFRPRQNSVFVSSQIMQLPKQPPRKTRSAMDIHSMILDEAAEAV